MKTLGYSPTIVDVSIVNETSPEANWNRRTDKPMYWEAAPPKKVSHLKELLPKGDDQKILSQSTKFKDRLFIPAKSERDNVCQLLTGNVTMQDFSETAEIRSENGQMIIEVVRHIMENFPEEMPRSYRKFLQNVCSPASVRGLLQVNFSENLCVVFFILLIIFV